MVPSDATDETAIWGHNYSPLCAQQPQRYLEKLVPWATDGRLPLSYLDLDLGSGHTAYRRESVIDLYLRTKFHWDRKKNFFESHHWGSESRDTKTRTNIKNPAQSNLDIVL